MRNFLIKLTKYLGLFITLKFSLFILSSTFPILKFVKRKAINISSNS